MADMRKAIACFKELGFKPVISQFQDRLVAQKIIYLLQLKGVQTGFAFGIYVRGPYSPDLAKALYENQGDFEELRSDAALDEREVAAARGLSELIGLKPGLLEVAATYAFFAFEERLEPLQALARLRKLKPFLSEAQIAVGVSRAKEFLFKPTEKKLKEMKEEFSPWQAASTASWRD